MISLVGWIALALGFAVLVVVIRATCLLRKDKAHAPAALSQQHKQPDHSSTSPCQPLHENGLNEVEQACLRTLQSVVGETLQVRCKQPVAALISKQLQPRLQSLADKQLQHIDFVLVQPQRETAMCAIQLRQPGPEQHQQLFELLNKSGVRVFELRRKSRYSVSALRQLLQPVLQHTPPSPDELAATISMQAFRLCRQCESRMLLKRARSGKHHGTLFWVCSKYPDCRFVELYKE